jgi:hypothetical protein
MSHTAEYRRILTRMGYYNYQNGLIYRHLDQDGGWDSHLEKCRNYIIRAVDTLRPKKVTILGSGWLMDLPLAELIEKTEKIILADIIHPPEVISQVAGFANVELCETDITGGLIDEVWIKTRGITFFKPLRMLSDIRIPDYKPDFDPGMVVSLNILTQLEALPLKYIRRKSRLNEAALIEFRKAVQMSHISFLSRYPSVLISDVREIITGTGDSGEIIPTMLADLPAGKMQEEWTWNFDKKGADFYNKTSEMKVVAVIYCK